MSPLPWPANGSLSVTPETLDAKLGITAIDRPYDAARTNLADEICPGFDGLPFPPLIKSLFKLVLPSSPARGHLSQGSTPASLACMSLGHVMNIPVLLRSPHKPSPSAPNHDCCSAGRMDGRTDVLHFMALVGAASIPRKATWSFILQHRPVMDPLSLMKFIFFMVKN